MSNNKTNSFSNKLSELEHIYHSIKNLDDKELDDLIALYQKGLLLSKELEKEIRSFELKITQIKQMHVSPPIEEEETAPPDTHVDAHTDISSSLDNQSVDNHGALEDIDFSEKGEDTHGEDEPSSHPQAHAVSQKAQAPDTQEKDNNTHPMKKYISDLFSDQD